MVTVEKLNKVFYSKIIDISSNSQIFNLNIEKDYLPNFELKVFILKNTDSSIDSLEELKNIRTKMLEIEQELLNSWEDIIIPYLPILYDIINKYPSNLETTKLDKTLLNKLVELRKKEQELLQNILPNYLIWDIRVDIDLSTIILNTKINTDRENYLPSDSQTIEINVKDSNWNPISWEALISIVDESLLALKNNDDDITSFFYSNKANKIKSFYNMSNLIKRFDFTKKISIDDENYLLSDLLWDSLDDSEWFFYKASNSTNSTKLRTNFKDLAYYKWVVEIIDWKATINVKQLPDNLTTWVIKWYTITPETKVWEFEHKFRVQKKLNLIPSLPRFFITKDILEITSLVINNSSKDLTVNASLDITNTKILESNNNIVVKANSTWYVSWKVKIDPITNEIDVNNFYSNIVITAKSWDLIDSLELKRKIHHYSTPEYSFTNGSTYDLSYEEKIFLWDNIDPSAWNLDISIAWTILTSLFKNIDKALYDPSKNFHSILSSIKLASNIKLLYKNVWELSKYEKIKIIDYLWNSKSVDQMINEILPIMKNYQTKDWWMSYYDDCYTTHYRTSCSNFDLTWDFLQTTKDLKNAWFEIDENLISKALSYYKKELEKIIKNYETNTKLKYNNIEVFYKILWIDNNFINKYILSDRFNETSFSNIEKLKLIIMHQEINPTNKTIDIYLKDIKNSILIEARWSLVPANNSSYYSNNNVLSTALALRVLINESEIEKLIVENFTRYILAQKNENWTFYSTYQTSEVIKAINNYIIYTKELENIDFEAKWFLNSSKIIEADFNNQNKFDILNNSYSLKDYIKFWENNSLWFEKTWTWKLYYDVWLRYYLPIEEIESRDEWIIVNRKYYKYNDYIDAFKNECYFGYYCKKVKTKNITEVNWWNKWDYLVGEIEIIVPSERNNVIVNNYIPSWAEIVNINLDTTSSEIKNISNQSNSSSWYWYDYIESHDEKNSLYADHLSKWTYTYTYVLKLNHKWVYHNRPAIAEEIKKPEIFGRTKWWYFEIR